MIPMTNKKLLMFAVAGAALVPSTFEVAQAAPPLNMRVINPAPVNDVAPIGGSPMPRLKRTDEEQPGNEMASVWFPPGSKKGLYFVATTELKQQAANRRIQGA